MCARVLEFATASPQERLRNIAESEPAAEPDVTASLELYEWFLQATGKPKPDVLQWMGKQSNRDEAFTHAAAFGDAVFRILQHVGDESAVMRYLAI